MGERWDRDRFMSERHRDERSRMGDDRSRMGDDRSRMGDDRSRMGDDDRFMRGGRGGRDFSADGRRDRRFQRSYEEDDMVRDRRYYEDDFRNGPRRERERSPGFDRPVLERVVLEQEPPRRRPNFLRRQSSLDTFDRPHHPIFHQREEYRPMIRREDIHHDDFRAPPYVPIPLPKTKALPPPNFDDFPQERVHEREVVRQHRRGRSRDGQTSRSRRSSSLSSSSSSSSSNSSGGTTVKSEYPKKGKTRIPAKLVSRKALIDLSYPFYEEGNTIVVLKALGQDNIDELLKVSEEYKKLERAPDKPKGALPAPEKKAPAPAPPAAQPPAAKAPAPPAPPAEAPPAKAAPPPPPPAQNPAPPAPAPAPAPEVKPAPPPPPPVARAPPAAPPVYYAPPPGAPPVAAPPVMAPPPMMRPIPGPGPVIITAPHPPPSESSVSEWVEEQYYRDYSPTRSTTTTSSYDTRHSHHRHRRENSAPVAMGPLALINRSRSRSKSRSTRSKSRGGRSKSRSGHELRSEIRALERELAHRPKGGYVERETVRAERLPDGQLVVYEEEVEDVVTHRKPPRIEKDKKGRMSISVPRRR